VIIIFLDIVSNKSTNVYISEHIKLEYVLLVFKYLILTSTEKQTKYVLYRLTLTLQCFGHIIMLLKKETSVILLF